MIKIYETDFAYYESKETIWLKKISGNTIFTTFKKSSHFKRDTETPLKTRRVLKRWRFQTRKKTRFHTPFLKTRDV
jgi:hypothetical protein